MKLIIHFAMLLLMLFAHLSSYAGSTPVTTLAPMLEKASPSVVNVKSQIKITDLETILKLQKEKQRRGIEAPIPDKAVSVASGVIVDGKNGYIITNAHVVDDAQSVVITLDDGRHYNAKIIGMDKASDIALLQIKAKNLVAIPIANSDALKVGDVVAAIGNPFGLNQTVTSGIVSALGRTSLGIESYENFIQTDASINSGNSGGALIDINGNLVGINTAILAPSRGNVGIGFAIPSNIAISVMKQLIQYGNVKRGALGVGAQDITPELAAAFHLSTNKGAAITIVMPNSPAYYAGLQPGDIITAINGSPVTKANDVVNAIAFMRVDSRVTIQALRDNKLMSFHAMITDPKNRKALSEKADPFLFGIAMKDLSVYSPLHGSINGIAIISVAEDSNAWHANLMPGDIITSANQQKTNNIAALKNVVANAKDTLLLNVLRGNGAIYLVVHREQ